MRYDFAPMEGLTDSVYRRLHHQYFGGVDRYYIPFFSPTAHKKLTAREERELPVASAVPFTAVPQVLTRSPEDFLWAAGVCRDRGYAEIDLNLGCPSGTVTAKGKGSGLLARPDDLARLLDGIFRDPPLPVSVKTRLGFRSPEEFPALLEIFNRYPIRELIVHLRTREEFYSGAAHGEWFRYAAEQSKNPLCYNGDVRTRADAARIAREFPGANSVMIGRGLIADPGMLLPQPTRAETLERFYDALLSEYLTVLGGSRNAMFRLKESWSYLLPRLSGLEKQGKRLRKATDLGTYRAVAGEIFQILKEREQDGHTAVPTVD